MEWSAIALDWVNCLRLTENPLISIKELGDGKFLCEILQILFRKTVNIQNKAQVFHVLKESLKGLYTPNDWIDYENAFEGNREELVKIIVVLIGFSSLQCEDKLFMENPSTYLSDDMQVQLKQFLESVLENGNTVDARFICNTDDKENGKEKNEISTLRNRIEVLSACQRDLMEEINSYKDESSTLTRHCEELEKENQSLKLKANLNKTFTIGSPTSETPEKTRNFANNLKDRLKRSENYVDVLESKIDEGANRVRKLEEDIAMLKGKLEQASMREEEMMKELDKDEQEKANLKSEVGYKDEIVRKLTQEIEDYRDSQPMNRNSAYDQGTSGILGLSICDSFNASTCSNLHGLSNCEEISDMASSVIEVQLVETQNNLKDLECTLKQITGQLEISEGKLEGTQTLLQKSENILLDTIQKLKSTEQNLEETLALFETSEKALHTKTQELETSELKFEETQALLDTSEKSLYATTQNLKSTEQKLEETQALLDISEKSLHATTRELETSEKILDQTPLLHESDKALHVTTQNQSEETPILPNAKTRSLQSIICICCIAIMTFFVFLFMPMQALSSTIEIIFGRQELSYVAEKYGQLQHRGIPMI